MDSAKAKNVALKSAVILIAIAAVTFIFAGRRDAGETIPSSDRKPVTQFSLPDMSGKEWKLTDYRGQVVLLNFWATWCGPCRDETPGLVRLANQYHGKGLQLAGVVMDDDKEAPVSEFVTQFGIRYPILVPPSNSAILSAISALPTTLLFDRHGRVVRRYEGAVSESQFRKDIEATLAEP
jgi:cytochrome c biogenesis protein CcmG, thiol:disulfide interchange protein DsbE